jgi:hypothetical protein
MHTRVSRHARHGRDRRHGRPRVTFSVGLLLLGLAAASCTGGGKASKVAFDSGLPVMRSGMTVDTVEPRGPYLEAQMKIDSWTLPVYAEPSESCGVVFQPGELITYVDNGPLGVFKREGESCQILGVGNLELWRDRNRRSTAGGVPRAQARYRTIHQDDDFVLLRGQFPLAGAVGFSGGMDIVAVVPNNDTCSRPIEAGVASMEYRGKGQRALSLIGQRGLCQLHGLIVPLSDAKPRKNDDT